MENTSLPKFRSAIGGFNRMDVVTYIESVSLKNAAELKKLREENATLKTQLSQYQQAIEAQEPSAAPDADLNSCETDTPTVPEEAALQEDTAELNAMELTAYRRAEAVEREAKARADRLNQQMDAVFSEALDRIQVSGSEANALCEDLHAAYERLQESLAEIGLIYEQATEKLQTLNGSIAAIPTADEEA